MNDATNTPTLPPYPSTPEQVTLSRAHILSSRSGIDHRTCERALTLGTSAIRSRRDRAYLVWLVGALGYPDPSPAGASDESGG